MKWTDLLNFDVFVILVIILTTLYFISISKRKKYKFSLAYPSKDQDDQDEVISSTFPHPKKKKKKRKNVHEERCREVFQRVFNKPFKSVRPDWLKNPATKKNLELDGFCSDIKTRIGVGLAFEYDGVQHAQYTNHFHKSGEHEFVYQTKKDSWKSAMCKQRGVLLVRIPHTVPFDDLERYIRNKLRNEGLLVDGSRFEPAFRSGGSGYDPRMVGMYA